MNIFLFAPALLVVLVREKGMFNAVPYLLICALVQLIIGSFLYIFSYTSLIAGIPFLLENWQHYLIRSFDLYPLQDHLYRDLRR